MKQAPATRFAHTVSVEEDGMRLDLLVGTWLARELGRPLSKSAVRKLIMAGAIRVAARPVRRPGSVVHARARLEAFIVEASLRTTAAGAATSVEVAILYEDDDLVAVAKPPGAVMHATADPRRPDLFTTVRQLLAQRAGAARPAQALLYLGLHHRLDVETSGVVLFTKQERANGGVAQQFARGEVTKVYHAVVGKPRGKTPPQWRIENRLAMSGSGRKARMQQAANGAPAVTDFAVLETTPAALVVEARPHTGRKHQIRAHLAGSGMPIVGDQRYGGPSRAGACAASRVMLHASSLSLRHPITGAPLTITCPYPPDFAACLRCLRRGS